MRFLHSELAHVVSFPSVYSTNADEVACIGIHLAMLELLLGTFLFFKQCPTAVLSPTTTNESMEFENYFLIAPKSHRCEVQLRQA